MLFELRLVLLVLLTVVGCGFRPTVGASRDADGSGFKDAPTDPVCGNGILESGEECELNTTTACTTSCGTGTQACTSSCTFDRCTVTEIVDPATAWEVSTNGTTWNPTTLPDTNWGCNNCTRYFRTTTCDRPTGVDFVWSSDNRAQMHVNGSVAFNTYWLTNYCTDAVCCTKCCDTPANCLANGSASQALDVTALQLFVAGPNTIMWEVNQETGGSGFYTAMTIRY